MHLDSSLSMAHPRIVVVGGSGKVALRFTHLARSSYTVSSLVRNESHFGAIQDAGGTPRLLSIEDATVGDLKSEFEGARGVLFAAGAGGKGGKDRTRKVDEEGAIKVCAVLTSFLMHSRPLGDERGAEPPSKGGNRLLTLSYARSSTPSSS